MWFVKKRATLSRLNLNRRSNGICWLDTEGQLRSILQWQLHLFLTFSFKLSLFLPFSLFFLLFLLLLFLFLLFFLPLLNFLLLLYFFLFFLLLLFSLLPHLSGWLAKEEEKKTKFLHPHRSIPLHDFAMSSLWLLSRSLCSDTHLTDTHLKSLNPIY